MAIKTVLNADVGDADHVGGNDWDNLATAINLGEGYKYLVVKSGSTYYVKNSAGETAHSGSNPTTEIQWAFDNLTSGRTYPERVILKGDFVMASKALMPSFVDIEVIGRIKIANGAETYAFENAVMSASATPANHSNHISIHGGEWDGNLANNPGGSGNPMIHFETAQHIDVRDVYMHDGKWGIACHGCVDARFHNIQINTMRGVGIGFDGSDTYGVDGQDCIITNSIAANCGVNGFWGHGAAALNGVESYGFSITNCIAHDCLFGGIYLDEKLWGYECVGNFVYANGDSTTSGGGIWVNGQQDGLPYFGARWNTITGNVCYQNKNDGMEISMASYILVANNICVENRWNGIFMACPHDCLITNNIFADNSTQTAGTWQGLDLIAWTGPDAFVNPVYNNVIRGNKCFDTRAVGSKTQQYGISIRASTLAYNNIIEDNDVRGNRAGQNAGIDTTDLSNCYNNKGFRTKRGRYTAVHPTEGCEGMLQGTISTFTNGAAATIAKTIDNTGTHMTYTTAATSSDTCGAKVTKITERDLQPTLKCKFRHPSGNLTRMFIGFHSNADVNPTTIASFLGNFSGIALQIDGQSSPNYRLITNDGTAASVNTDSTVAFDTGVHELQILCDNGSGVMFVIDDVLMTGAKITSQVPAVGTDLGIFWAIQTQGAATKVLDVWDVEVLQKD